MGARGAVIRMKEGQIVEAFRRAGATSRERAVFASDIGADADGVGMRRLHRNAVIREAGDGRVYLDEEVWTAVRGTRRRLGIVLLVVVLLAALVLTGVVPFDLGLSKR